MIPDRYPARHTCIETTHGTASVTCPLHKWPVVLGHAALIVAAVAAASSPALAQTGDAGSEAATELDRIIVTASKTDTTLIDYPASATVLDTVTIERSRIEQLGDIDKHVPNLSISRLGEVGGNFITIRGISSNPSVVNRTAVYIDDVPYRTIDNQLLVNVEQIEVLRGPQGVLYGANTEAGVVVIRTRDPSDRFSARAGFGVERFSDGMIRSGTGSVSGPLSERVRGSLAASVEHADAFVENPGATVPLDPRIEREGIAGTLAVDVTDRLTATLRLSAQRTRAPGMFEEEFLPINRELYNTLYRDTLNQGIEAERYQIVQDVRKSYNEDEYVASLNLTREFDGARLVSVSSFRRQNDEGIGAEADFTALPLFNAGGNDRLRETYQEFRLLSAPGAKLEWLGGTSFLHSRRTLSIGTQDIAGGASGMTFASPQRQGGRDYAVFGNLRLPLLDGRLGLAVGGRYERARRDIRTETQTFAIPGLGEFVVPGVDAQQEFEVFLPRVAADFRLNNRIMLYANAARGWQPGGFNLDAFSAELDDGFVDYAPEHLWSYEIGAKGTAADGVLRWSVAAFYTKAKNWQEMNLIVDESGLAQSTSIISSRAELTAKGIEAEAQWRPLAGLTVVGGFGYTDGQYGRYVFSSVQDFSGSRTIVTPRYDLLLAVDYETQNRWFVRGEATARGDTMLDNANRARQDAYVLLGLSLGWRGEDYTITVYGDNLTNEYVFAGQAFNNPVFGDDGVFYAPIGQPRRFGIKVSRKW